MIELFNVQNHKPPGKKLKRKQLEDALNENLDYCNELAKRINLMADAFSALSKRLELLESKNE